MYIHRKFGSCEQKKHTILSKKKLSWTRRTDPVQSKNRKKNATFYFSSHVWLFVWSSKTSAFQTREEKIALTTNTLHETDAKNNTFYRRCVRRVASYGHQLDLIQFFCCWIESISKRRREITSKRPNYVAMTYLFCRVCHGNSLYSHLINCFPNICVDARAKINGIKTSIRD